MRRACYTLLAIAFVANLGLSLAAQHMVRSVRLRNEMLEARNAQVAVDMIWLPSGARALVAWGEHGETVCELWTR